MKCRPIDETCRRAGIAVFACTYVGALVGLAAFDLARPGELAHFPGLGGTAVKLVQQLQGPPSAWLFAPEPAPMYWQISVCIPDAQQAPSRSWAPEHCSRVPYRSLEQPASRLLRHDLAGPTRSFRFAESLASAGEASCRVFAEHWRTSSVSSAGSSRQRAEVWMHSLDVTVDAEPKLRHTLLCSVR